MGNQRFKAAVKKALLKAQAQHAFHVELNAMNTAQRACVDKAMQAGWRPKQMDGDVVWLDHPDLGSFMMIDEQGTYERVKRMRVSA